jgi:hypothetical protein
MELKSKPRTKAQEATQAIERIYITMRHLFNRGYYKPMGVSGTTLREGLFALQPEIYGSMAEDKLELNGMVYVLDRLPHGIEECTIINLTSSEGYDTESFPPIIPEKRRRNCYRIDKEQMNIEITRGRSDIYDILTHLTFLFIESHKIAERIIEQKEQGLANDWEKLQKLALKENAEQQEIDVALAHTANIIGRTFEETKRFSLQLATEDNPLKFLKIIYWLAKHGLDELNEINKRSITFSSVLRERLGHHVHGEVWADVIKEKLKEQNLLGRTLHIISANMHSVMNSLFAKQVLSSEIEGDEYQLYELLSKSENGDLRNRVTEFALENGMTFIKDTSGTNIDVQLFDLTKINLNQCYLHSENSGLISNESVLIVMDYAFGEQAFETLDELLKPYKKDKNNPISLDVASISIMGKAGILSGDKGDIMIPTSHIFEGTADNYPFQNSLSGKSFEKLGFNTVEGTMITVLGTSLQNREMLSYFKKSSWGVVGLEMEGAHYQKAIQAAAKIRKNIRENVELRYAYYASDNPLETGKTLASGGLGLTGVKPTYGITLEILKQILKSN